ncbi:MAG: tRNA (adenosine(37)-N6)-threonylcarbamoyltransferase complex ATPase subunit type 1 TsaE [Aestuariivirgaceae bacterium]|nr:tRNA (adenosine(37)-N6)-threonylcarbamoyltransferase complex ATPase subunit type 1 TsaE [Aestuariivirgaceae bacterium]
MDHTRHLADETATQALAAELVLVARAGDVILLEGDLGTGKSTFARAFIRALAGNAGIEVPSPTFTLLQTYGDLRLPVAHADLYRLAGISDTDELGLTDLAQSHVLLIEWPDRLEGHSLGRDTLTVSLAHEGESRTARLIPQGSWKARLAKLAAIQGFLDKAGWGKAARRFLEGDASSRRYERLKLDGKPAVLMDMPERDDTKLLKNGRTYSETAKLAHSVTAAAAIARALKERGYSAPETYASDLAQGFLLTQDLGDQVYGRLMQQGADMREPMGEAVAVLARLANESWPGELAAGEGKFHTVPAYDLQAYEIELDLFLEWFLPAVTGQAAQASVAWEFAVIWKKLLAPILAEPPVLVLRDYHSPNLIWIPEREGLQRAGLIDTQDALMGHPAYDLGSLLQDARVSVAPETAAALLDHYCALRKAADPRFDEASLRRACLILSTQRLLKVLGIFVRLSRRDGKHGYLRLIPNLMTYLTRNLADPELAQLAQWRQAHLPREVSLNA